MDYREFLQRGIYVVIDPIVRGLLRIGCTPNMITFAGFVGNVLATALFVIAIYSKSRPLVWIGYGGVVLLLAGLCDMLDGRVARVGSLSSRFGAFWDSTLDRYSELLSLSGLAAYIFSLDSVFWGMVTLVALIGSIMVSYVRARVEALGLQCKVGILQRPERVVLLSVGAMLTGLFSCIGVMYVVVAIIAVLANYTAGCRIWHCYKNLRSDK